MEQTLIIVVLIFDLFLLTGILLLGYIVFNHLRNHRIANQWRKMYEAEQDRVNSAYRHGIWERLDKLERGKLSVRHSGTTVI